MAIQFVGASKGVHDYAQGRWSGIQMPAGIRPGDLLIASQTWPNPWWGTYWFHKLIQPAPMKGWKLLGRDSQDPDDLSPPERFHQWGYYYYWGRHFSAYRIADGTEEALMPSDFWWYQAPGGVPGAFYEPWWFSTTIAAYRGVTAPIGYVGDFSEQQTVPVPGQVSWWQFKHPSLVLPTPGYVILNIESLDNWWWPGDPAPSVVPLANFVADDFEQDAPQFQYGVHLWAHSTIAEPKGPILPITQVRASRFRNPWAQWWGQAIVVNELASDEGLLL